MKTVVKTLVVLCVVATACQGTRGAPESPDRPIAPEDDQRGSEAPEATNVMPSGPGQEFNEIIGDGSSQRQVNLCELVRFYPLNRGLYRVQRLVGYTEEVSDGLQGVTYVELSPVETRPGETVSVARISGGPIPPDIMQSWRISLTVGEVVLLLFDEPRIENRGYYGLDSPTVFRRLSHGGFSNGQLFTQTATGSSELLAMIDQILDVPTGCPVDAEPDYGRTPDSPRIPDGRFEGHVEAGEGGL